jgi:hypothetical protein
MTSRGWCKERWQVMMMMMMVVVVVLVMMMMMVMMMVMVMVMMMGVMVVMGTELVGWPQGGGSEGDQLHFCTVLAVNRESVIFLRC